MANFSQLVRRQSSRDVLFARQFSQDVAERWEMREFEEHDPHKTWHGKASQKYPSILKNQHSRERRESGGKKKSRDSLGDSRLKREDSPAILEREEEKIEEKEELIEPPKAPEIDPKNLLSPVPDVVIDRPESRASQFSQPPDAEGGEVRESWDSKITFMLATIGYAVGLGNVWRFPYLAQKNGGGAFLIPYWIMLFAEGLPMFLLEMAIGQRLRKGSLGAWDRVSPYWGGIGVASAIVSFNVALYYNTVIAWCLSYFVQSFRVPLPWSECPALVDETNQTTLIEECEKSSPTQYFWYRNTLEISDDVNNPDNFNWPIAGCLLLAWCLVYLCIVKGITENPKIIYITAIYPYVVLIIFFFRAITLEGMEHGISHLFKPKFEKLADPVVWLEAGTQIFFSLGLAFGGLIAYSSYNPVNNNCTKDALVVAFTNCATSMFAGIVIFAIMGFKATQTHKKCVFDRNITLTNIFGEDYMNSPDLPSNIKNLLDTEKGHVIHTVAGIDGQENSNITLFNCNIEEELDNSASGTGLAFILFTEAVNQFPAGNVWALLFFLMLFTLGLDSQFGTLQGVVQCAIDLKLFPNLRKEILTGAICGVCLVVSLIFAQGAGNYVFTLFDNFSGSIPLLIIALCECIAVAYCYGLRRFSNDIELMTGSRPNLYWLICWKFISPVAMTGILVASFVQMVISGSTYDAWDAENGVTIAKEWPLWCKCLAIFLIGICIIWVPIVAILAKIQKTFIPHETAGWFPEEELRTHYGLDKERKATTIEKKLFGFRDDGREGLIVPTFPRIETKLSMGGKESNDGDSDLSESTKFSNQLKPTDVPSSHKPVFSISTIQED